MNENLADEIRKTIESIKDMKTQASGINNYLGILEGMMRADIQKKVDEAYQRGLEEGKKATWGLVADASSAEYQRGLDDAWECMKKIAFLEKPRDMRVFFGCSTLGGVLIDYSASEAIAKLKTYEEKQKAEDDIKVGDEVNWGGDCFIVTRIFQPRNMKEQCDGIDNDGCVYHDVLMDDLEKTGRHSDIMKILEEMRHD